MAEVCVAFSVPGPNGLDGADGINGGSGISALMTTSAAFTMPAEGADVTLDVDDSRGFVATQKVYVGVAGTMEVRSKPSSLQVVLRNLKNTAGNLYLDNVAPVTVIVSGTSISPSGGQGTTGTGLTGALLIAQDLNDVVNKPTARANMGLAIGTNVQAQDATLQSIASLGTVADRYIYTTGVDTWVEGVLTTFGRSLLDDANAAAGIATLGLGTMATQNAAAVAITGGSLIGAISITSTLGIASSNLTASGETKLNGQFYTAPSVLQSLAAAATINPNRAKILVEGSGGAVTLTSTPHISAATADGQQLQIMGTSAANTLTLRNAVTWPGSGLMLGAANRVLGLGDILSLSYSTALGLWCETGYVDNS